VQIRFYHLLRHTRRIEEPRGAASEESKAERHLRPSFGGGDRASGIPNEAYASSNMGGEGVATPFDEAAILLGEENCIRRPNPLTLSTAIDRPAGRSRTCSACVHQSFWLPNSAYGRRPMALDGEKSTANRERVRAFRLGHTHGSINS
jgi:hypothetical protein